ncbi:MAG: DUF1223 domain-containing protein [Bdellovibrionales bacterium]|nr:DUF1223 domain-containing protein [Bdellovibrionales bacterium]
MIQATFQAIWSVTFSCLLVISTSSYLQADSGFAIVELFTSQGCSSCPPADEILQEIARMAQKEKLPIYTLSYHVNYWNRLGWTDPYSGKNATDRQYQYAQKVFGTQSVYTPQAIINGRYDVSGNDRRKLLNTIGQVRQQDTTTRIDLSKLTKTPDGTLTLRYKISGHLVGDELRVALVAARKTNFVPSGENAGRTLSHTNVVQRFTTQKLDASGVGSIMLAGDHADTLIAFVQNPRNFRITSATQLPL